MMIRNLLMSVMLMSAYGCAGTSINDKGAQDSGASAKQCLASQPKNAHMWINSMPSPDSSGRAPLRVTFTVTTPTPGYQFALEVDQVKESFPEQVVLDLIVSRPDGIVAQVITETDVNIKLDDFPGSVGSSVQINCAGKPFLKVNEVMAVY